MPPGRPKKEFPDHLNLSPELISRYRTIRPHDMSDEEFLEQLIHIALGFHCTHANARPYMEVVTDNMGYLDLERTLDKLHDLRLGKETGSLVRLCKDCYTAKRILL